MDFNEIYVTYMVYVEDFMRIEDVDSLLKVSLLVG